MDIIIENSKVKELLEAHNDVFTIADDLIGVLNSAAIYINSLNLDDKSIWWNKANFFTLVIEVVSNIKGLLEPDLASGALGQLGQNLPSQYVLAAREAVNNRPQRLLRGRHVAAALTGKEPEVASD